MTSRSLCGRADLVRALAKDDPALFEAFADGLGYDLKPPSEPKISDGDPEPTQGISVISDPGPVEPPELEEQPLSEVPLWRVLHHETVFHAPEEPNLVMEEKPVWQRANPKDEPRIRLLSPWSDLNTRLRQALNLDAEGTEPDIGRAIEQICEGTFLEQLPRLSRRRWPSGLQVIIDRSERLVPFWVDQDQVMGELARLSSSLPLEQSIFHEGVTRPKVRTGPGAGEAFMPRPEGIALVLGDLGCLKSFENPDVRPWFDLGEQLRAAGCRPVALVPCPIWRVPAKLRRIWHILPWERDSCPSDMPSMLRDRAEFLLRLISPAIRIEPGFLRAVRTSLGPGFGNAGTEADVWQRLNPHHVAASFEPKQAKRYREEFSKLKIKRQKQVLSLLRVWHQHLPDEIWLEEVLNLSPNSQRALPERQDLADARKFFTYVGQAFAPKNKAVLASSRRHWFWRFDQRMTDQTGDDPVGRSLRGLAFDLFKEDPGFQPSDSLDPAAIIRDPDKKERPLSLGLEGGGLVVSAGGDAGSLLGHIRSANELLRVETVSDRDAFWSSGRPPSWADSWGEDETGFWVIIKVDGAAGDPIFQKLRWISPGRFMMGSPSGEDDRYDDEDPRHEVIFDRGYWLFDTPCTQDLWEALMGENPSNSKGGSRPVENVSWKDAKTFIERLNDRHYGLSLDLPSEAQWEYACRAGTTTAYSYGDRADAKQMNSDESGIKETTSVGRYPRNGWGLYDMHGNVWEWCADLWHENYEGAPVDGSSWGDDEATDGRVMRGGSWADGARSARAAYRSHFDPEDRYDIIGFRCARVQASDGEAEPAGLASRRKAEPRRAQDPPGGAAAIIRLAEGESRIFHPLPEAPTILIRSDREQLTLSRITKPEWASGIGRDRFGLYATFSVEPDSKRGGLVSWLKRMDFRESASLSPTGLVTQKMRWIPPGRFMMGSPEDETGRWTAEGSQHEVTFGQGYWLFDTPCTQALWGAVMNKNPSRFKSPDRPAENVGWNDIQGFFETLNERVEGLALALPSEAQWEYACRAGTTTSSYVGEIEFIGENNAPLLDDIAWYSGNSGVDFELENGHDSSDWKEKQYPHEKAGTRPVGQKRANPFGLYDMLGNVWEWCVDPWHENYEGAPTDGSSWGDDEASGDRVMRGGSWALAARSARAAFRIPFVPGDRIDYVGFRCARVQAE